MPGAFKPPRPPKRLCGIRAYETPARPRWGLCFCVSGGRIPPNVCRVRISHLSAVDVSDGSIASFERRRHVGFTPDFGPMTGTQRTDALGQEET
jgi:hypothetical protein